jgi:hypothetical protein
MGGVTTALLWILEQHFLRVGTHVPIYVQADARFSLGRVQSAISAARTRADDIAAPVIIAIDDVSPVDTRALGRLIRTLKENPQVVFLLGCHDDDHETISRALGRHDIEFARFYLGPFGRRETRALVARIAGPEGDDLVQRILRLIQRQRLPRNPLNLAALVSVIVREPNLTAINESGLLQSYVVVLLENPTAVDPEGLNMDYRRREHLLEEIARHVVEKDISRIPRLEIERLVINYFDSIGYQSGSAGQQVDSLIHRRVLAEDERGVGFRYPALLHLFAAKAIGDSPGFADLIFSDPRTYAPIIKHVAGLRRNDAETLKRAYQKAGKVRQEVAGAVTVEQFNLIKDRHGWSKIRSLEDVRALVRPRPEPPSEEELDDIYDESIEEPEESVEISPFGGPDPVGAMDQLVVAFSLAASVLQSSELVRDVGLRKEALREIITGWSVMTVLFALEEDMSRGIHELVEPMFKGAKDDERRDSMIEHVARLFVINLMSVSLYMEAGSIHHETILAELLDEQEFVADSANALMGTLLYAMLSFPDWPVRLDALFERHGRHPMVSELIRIWSFTEYQTGELSKRDFEAVEDLLVKILTPDPASGGQDAVPVRAAESAIVRDRLQKSRTEARWAEAEEEEAPEGTQG